MAAIPDESWVIFDNVRVESVRTVVVDTIDNGSTPGDGKTSLLEALLGLQENDRITFFNPDAEEILVEDFGQVFERLRIDHHSYLAIVTRGHKCDQIVLEQAVRTEARYVGMIGSRRKTLTLLQKLRDKGISRERLERVYSPIGLSIGAVTAEEIALGIVGEFIKVRRLGDEPGIGHMTICGREGVV